MKNSILLALLALGATAQVAAGWYDENGNYHHGWHIFGGHERREERRDERRAQHKRQREERNDDVGVVRKTTRGAHEVASGVAHDTHDAASHLLHDIF